MAVMKKSAPKDDPWTTPLADRYDETPGGRHSATSPVEEAADTATNAATSTKSEIIDAPDETDGHNPTGQAQATDITHKNGRSKVDAGKVETQRDDANKAEADKAEADKAEAKKSSASKNGSDKNPLR
jgi:hypothetical protein